MWLRQLAGCNGDVLEDSAIFNRVSENNTSYEAPVNDKGNSAENWFNMPDFSDVVVEDIEITDDVYSTRCTFGEIVENDEAKAVLKKYFGNIDEHPSFAMTLRMTIDTVSTMQRMFIMKK